MTPPTFLCSTSCSLNQPSGAYVYPEETGSRDMARSKERTFREDLVNNAVSYIKTLHPKCTVEGKVVDGDAATEILAMANQIDCDLIVLGTHARRGLARVIVGRCCRVFAERCRLLCGNS